MKLLRNILTILIVLATSTILNACYFLPIVYAAFFKEARSGDHASPSDSFPSNRAGIKEAPAFMVASLVLTAVGALVLFFSPGVFLDLARITVTGMTGGP